MQKFSIKNKMLGMLVTDGQKYLAEKNLLKTVKLIQVLCTKQGKKSIGFGIVAATPILKTHQKVNKKNKSIQNSSLILVRERSKISWALKSILVASEKIKTINFIQSRLVFILMSCVLKNNTVVELKNQSQEQALLNKRIFLNYYRWN